MAGGARARPSSSHAGVLPEPDRAPAAPWFGPRRLDGISPDDLALLVRELRSRGFSESTIVIVLGITNRVYRYAVRRLGWASTNPVSLMLPSERPKPSHGKRRRIFEGRELEQTIRAASEPYRTLFTVAALTGGRLSELLALTCAARVAARHSAGALRRVPNRRLWLRLPWRARRSSAEVHVRVLEDELRLYRATWAARGPAQLDSFRSHYELQRPPRGPQIRAAVIHMAVPMFERPEPCWALIDRTRGRIGDHVAELRLAPGVGVCVARTGGPLHWSV